MRLKLDRPLVLFDLETTGPVPETDRIVQIAAVKLLPDGTRIEKQTLVNPLVPIPAEATSVHGLTDAAVASAPPFQRLAKALAEFFDGADIGGYNVRRFDWPCLLAEWTRAGLAVERRRRFIDAQVIYFRQHPRDLAAAVREYTGTELLNAHSALADVLATEQVLEAQLQRHAELPDTVAEIDALLFPVDPLNIDADGKLRWNASGEACINFGKHKGVPLQKAEAGFLRWVLANDFPDEVKTIVRDAMGGRYPQRSAA